MPIDIGLTPSPAPTAEQLAAARAALYKTAPPMRNRRILAVGDSFFASDDADTGGTTEGYGYIFDASASPATVDNITRITQRSSSPLNWFNFLSGQQFDLTWSQVSAVGGQTSSDAMEGLEALLIASKAGTLLWQPGTNDWQLTEAFDGSPALGYEATIINDQIVIDLCRRLGVQLVRVGIAPRNGWTDSPDATTLLKRRRGILKVNTFAAQAAKLNPGMAYADTWATLADPASTTGGIFTNRHRGDGLHLSDGMGAIQHAKAIWQAFQNLGYVYSPPVRNYNLASAYHADDNPHGNRFGNGALQGTVAAGGTGMSGTNPTDFALARTAGTQGACVGSQVDRSEGADYGDCQQYVFSIPSTGSANEQFRAETPNSTDFTVGEFLFARIGVEYVDAVGMKCPSLQMRCLDGGGAVLAYAETNESTGAIPNGDMKGVLQTDPIKVPVGTVNVRVRFLQTVDGASTSNGGTVKLTDLHFGSPVDEADALIA